ncbi:hypothetical protein [Bifidobacterium eulemuris]|uniref:Uncharacterized protein n=1 Tax=Bifidobacterium eulemuris TaxID=1765219 RepID=A0A261GAH6_9BIFI|nr:hypothetical protein [Bifidobacterium eulemuris]OZG68243.1 hypothetical protein BEUL_1256 [Bifidobacterium eulemuris]QOL31701.1 hypothetical protein BE0216_03910 [Bifidobacterium eulemuris]
MNVSKPSKHRWQPQIMPHMNTILDGDFAIRDGKVTCTNPRALSVETDDPRWWVKETAELICREYYESARAAGSHRRWKQAVERESALRMRLAKLEKHPLGTSPVELEIDRHAVIGTSFPGFHGINAGITETLTGTIHYLNPNGIDYEPDTTITIPIKSIIIRNHEIEDY